MDSTAEDAFLKINEIIRIVRNIRTEMQIPFSEKTDLYLVGNKNISEWALAKEHQSLLLALTPTAHLFFTEKEPSLFGSSALLSGLKLIIPIPDSFRLKEKTRLEKEKEKHEKIYSSTEQKLKNEDFRAKAPREVVEKLEKNLSDTQKLLEEIEQKLKNLFQ